MKTGELIESPEFPGFFNNVIYNCVAVIRRAKTGILLAIISELLTCHPEIKHFPAHSHNLSIAILDGHTPYRDNIMVLDNHG